MHLVTVVVVVGGGPQQITQDEDSREQKADAGASLTATPQEHHSQQPPRTANAAGMNAVIGAARAWGYVGATRCEPVCYAYEGDEYVCEPRVEPKAVLRRAVRNASPTQHARASTWRRSADSFRRCCLRCVSVSPCT